MSSRIKIIIAIMVVAATPLLSMLNMWMGLTTGVLMAYTGFLFAFPRTNTNFNNLAQPARDWVNRLPNANEFIHRLNGLTKKNEIRWVEKMIDLKLVQQH